MDATQEDATFIDAAMKDAGSRDAGRRDAGERDAEIVDASREEPPLHVSESVLSTALKCPEILQGIFDPVLFVHGTGATAALEWDWTYGPVLTARGYDVCTIDLPSSSWEDITVASSYVALAIRAIAARTSRPVAVIGHSQGTLEIRWALRYWPSLAALVTDVIGLAGVDHGAAQAQSICALGFCRVATWQMRPGSAFLTALGDDVGPLRYTSLYSTTDTTAVAPTSVLTSANNIAVQDVCPGREVSHAGMISDAVVFALVIATLQNPEHISLSEIDESVCSTDRFAPITAAIAKGEEGKSTTYFLATYLGGREPGEEPPLPAYATTP